MESGANAPRPLLEWAESFLEHAPSPVTLIRRAGYRLMYGNSAFRRLHSLPAAPRERPVSDFFDPLVEREIRLLVDSCVAPQPKAHVIIVTPRSGERALHCSAWPLAERDGREPAIVMVEMRPATDVDEEHAFQVDLSQRLVLSALQDQLIAEAARAAETAADLANAAKDRFLSTMSHELRTPLNAIGGYAELIDMGLRGPVTPAQREDLSRIQRAQVHLLGLINSVLNFSKLESGTVQFEMTAVPLSSTLDTVQEMLLPHLGRQGLSYQDLMKESPEIEPLLVIADPEKLRQVLINLLTNAIKFTAPGGTITVSCDATPEAISLHVRDTGRGISADQLSSVFDPFVQVGRRLSSNDQGVGLGLSISRDLARGMGGDLTVTSKLDVGSTFTLTLRRAPVEPASSPQASDTSG